MLLQEFGSAAIDKQIKTHTSCAISKASQALMGNTYFLSVKQFI